MKAIRLFSLLIISALSTISLFGQSYLIPIDAPANKYPITFTDAAQQTLILNFDRAVTAAGTTAGWTVTVGGAPVALAGVPVFAGNSLRIQIVSSIPYANRNTVLVTYNAGIGTMSLTGPVEPNFANVQAVNNYIAVAADFSNGLYGEIPPVDICAAVQNVDVSFNLTLSQRYRNSIHYALPKAYITWQYPLDNPKSQPSFVETGGVGSGIYSITSTFAGYPDNTTNCTWVIGIYPYIFNAVGTLQPNLYVTQNLVKITIPNYKKDNGTPVPGTGDLGLNPPIDDPSTLFCVGENIVNFIFTDATVFDCRLAVETDLPNIRPRNVQFVYGTQVGASIPNVFITVGIHQVQITDAAGNPMPNSWTVDPNGNIVAPYSTTSGFFEGPVTTYTWDAFTKLLISPMAQTYPINHTGDFINDMENDIFDVTLRNWGPCNPYDGLNPLTYLDAVTEISRLRLVGAPPLPTAPDVTVCSGASTLLSATRNGANPGILHWYNNASLLPAAEVGTGATYNPGALAAGTYNYWVREIGTTGLFCEGPAEQVVLTINPTPSTPTISRNNPDFCFDGTSSITLTANPNTPPAISSYQWYRNGVAVGGATASTIVLGTVAQSGTYTCRTFGVAPTNCPSALSNSIVVNIWDLATVTTQPSSGSICENGSTSFTMVAGGAARNYRWQRRIGAGAWVDITAINTPNDGCNYSNFTTATLGLASVDYSQNGYQYRMKLTTTSGACDTYSNAVTLTVNPLANITAQPPNRTVCELDPTTFTVTANAVGTSSITGYQWQRNNGAWTNITAANTPADGVTYGGWNTATLSIGSTTAASNGFQYRVVITTTGGCTITSNAGTLTVNQLADITAQPPNRAICAATNTTFTITDDGNPAVTGRQWQVSTNGGGTWNNLANGGIYSDVTTATLVLTNVTTAYNSYQYRCILTTAGPCTITSNPGLLTVHANPIDRVVTAADSWLCYNTGTNINLATSEAGTVYQLRTGVTNVGGTQNGSGANLAFATGNLLATTTFNVYASRTTTIGISTLTCNLQMTNTPTVNVNPNLTITNLTHPDICLDGTIDLPSATPAGGSTNYTYAWTGTGGYTNNVQNPASFAPASGSGAYSYTVTVTDEGFRTASADNTVCTVADAIPFTVNPLPAIGMVVTDPTICAGATATITLQNSISGTRYQLRLDSDDSNVGASVNGTGGNITFNVTPAVTTTYNILATIILTGCDDEVTDKSTVTVNPNPTPVISGLNNVCAGATPIGYSTPAAGGRTYVWNISGGVIIGGAGTNAITVTWGAAGAGWVRVTETIALTGCAVTTANYAVTINPGPPVAAPSLTSGATEICKDGTLVVNVSDVATASQYEWDYSWLVPLVDATTATSDITINLTGLAIGTYTVRARGINGCGPGPWMPVHTFDINDIPDLSPAGATLCSGTATGITFGVANFNATYNSGHTYNITAINNGGLSASAGSPTVANGLADNVIADDVWNNTTGNNVNVVYTVVPVSTQGCTGLAETVTITVKPIPVITAGLAQTICNLGSANRSITTTNAPALAGVTYTWLAPVMTGGMTGGTARAIGSGLPITDTFTNNGTAPQTATYTVTPVYNGCTGANQSVVITVNPTAQVTDPVDMTLCNNAASGIISFATNRTLGVTTYSWSNNNIAIGLGANGTGNIPSFTATNGGTAPISATITVTPTFTYNTVACPGPAETFTITVNPTAQVTDPTNVTYCNNFAVPVTTFSTNRTVGVTSYAWSNNNIAIGLAANGTGNLPAFTATNGGTAPISATITVTPTFTYNGVGCPGPAETFTITVNPTAQVNDPADRTFCHNGASGVISFTTDRTVGATNYAWSNNNTAIGLGANGIGNIASFTATNAGSSPITATITVTPTFTYNAVACTGPAETFTITVNPTAQVDDPADQVRCNGVATAPITFTTDRTGGVTTYSWANNTPSIGLAANGTGNIAAFTATNATAAPVVATITVTPTFTNNLVGCPGPVQTFTITVNPTPMLSTTLTPAAICSNTAFVYNPASNTAGTNFSWNRPTVPGITPGGPTSGTGNPNEVLRNQTNATIAVTYEYTLLANGCSNVQNVIVNVKPEPVITALQNPAACSGNPLNYKILMDNFTNPGANVTFTWLAPVLAPNDPGFTGGLARGTSSAANITDTFTNTTGLIGTATYTVTPVYNGCAGNPVDVVVSVGSEPVLNPGLNRFACSAEATGLILSPAAGSVTPTYYSVVLQAIDAGLVPNWAGNNLPNATAAANFLATHVFTNTTAINQTVTYRVTPILAPDCIGDPVDVVVTIRPPIAPGSIIGNTAICYNSDAPAITNGGVATGGDGLITYSWYYTENLAAMPGDANWTLIPGETANSYNPGVLVNPTKYIRKAEDGSCIAEVYTNMITININPLPVTPPITGDAILCETATNKVYQVVNRPGSTYQWSVPASLNRTSPQGLYFIIVDATGPSLPGDNITVVETLTSTTGCVGLPVIFPITIVDKMPGEVVSGPLTVCQGATGVKYSVTDNPGSSYSWVVPAGASITSNPSLHEIDVTFNLAGSGPVSVVEMTGTVCTTIHTGITVTINPLPTVFTISSPVAYCAGDPGVTLTLSDSEAGVNYQLLNGGVPEGAPLAGTGNAITWANKVAGSYTVVATNAATTCTQPMNGTATPVINVITGGTVGTDQAVCEGGTPVPFTDIVAATGGGSLTYQWQSSPDNAAWVSIAGATSAVFAPGNVLTNTYYRRLAYSTMGTSICSAPSNSILVTAIIFTPGTTGPDQTICEGSTPLAIGTTPPGGVGLFTYQWQESTDGTNFSNIGGAILPAFTPGALTADTWYRIRVTSTLLGVSCVEFTNATKVNVINFAPGSIGSDQTICDNTAPAAFTSVAATGDGTFVYSWESSPDGNAPWTALGVATPTYTSPVLGADTYFRRKATATLNAVSCDKYSNTIHVTINEFNPGTISAPQTICEGSAPAAFTSVTPTGKVGATYSYQWLSSTDGVSYSAIGGATNETYTSGVLTVDTYFRRQVTSTLNGRACIDLTPAILVTVNNVLPGSIAGAQTICEGDTPAPLTQSGAVTADGAVTYQWQEALAAGGPWNNVAAAGNAATYAPGALTVDTWYKRVVTSTLTGVPCTAESNVIKITVNNFIPGNIAGDQTICDNSAAAPLSSVTPSGDGAFTYKWFSSTDGTSFVQVGGAISETYSPGTMSQDMWYFREVTSTLSGKACIERTDTVNITVIDFVPGSISGDATICEGVNPAALGSVLPTGDGSFGYIWQESNDAISWSTIPLETAAVYDPPALLADTWYKRIVTATVNGVPCVEETNFVKFTVINFAPGSIAGDQTICEGAVPAPFTSVAASGDGVKSYQWQNSTNGIAFANIGGATSATYSSPAISVNTWFRRLSTATVAGESCTEITDTALVTVIIFDPGTVATPQTICEGDTPAPLTGTVPVGNGVFTYQWQSSLDDVTYTNITGATLQGYAPPALFADTYFRREVTSTLNGRQCKELTGSVLVTVNNLTPGGIAGTQTICEGDIPAPLTESSAAVTDGAITYQWQEAAAAGGPWANVAAAGNGATYAPPALTQDTWYKRLVTSTVAGIPCTEESNVIKVTVNNFIPGNIAGDQVICNNTAGALLTSVTPTGDGVFTYKWFKSINGTIFNQIGGATSETYNPGVLTADAWYFREVTSTLSGKACIERTDTVVITVNNLTPGSIADNQTICEGGDPAAFTSVLPTFDGALSYQWQSSIDGVNFNDIALATSETYDSPALTEDTWFRRAVTSTIGANACTEYTNSVKVTVINFVPGSIGSDQTICEGTVPAAFTSVAASGDGAKTYQWQNSTDGIAFANIGGALSATYNSPLLTQDTWFRRLSTATVSGVQCTEITDTILVTVNNMDPGAIAGVQTICEDGTPAPLTSTTAATSDGALTYQWQSSIDGSSFSNITGATLATLAPGPLTADTWYRRQATSVLNGNQCVELTADVLISVNNITPGSIAGTQTICEGSVPAAFTSAAASADGAVVYQWQESTDNGTTWANVAAGGNVEIYVAPALTSDRQYKRLVTSTFNGVPCTEESNVITVTVNNFVPGSITADQIICENTAPAPFTSVTPAGDGVFTYKWYRSTDGTTFGVIGTAVSETYSPGLLTVDTWYYRQVTSTLNSNVCVEVTDTVLVQVNNFTPGSIGGTQTICEGADPAVLTSVAPGISDGGIITYQWQSSDDGIVFADISGATAVTFDPAALTQDTWYKRITISTLGTNVCSEESNIIKITVINFAPGAIGSDQTICNNTAPTPFTSVAASGDGVKSYQWQNSADGVAFANIVGALSATYTSPALTQDTWFRRLSTSTVLGVSCTEITDTIRITVINFLPGSVTADQTICEGSIPAPFGSVAPSGDGAFTFQWQSSTDGVSFSNISGATTATYAPDALNVDTWFRRQVTSELNSMFCTDFTAAIKVTVNNMNPGTIGGAQNICEGDVPAVLTSTAPATGDGTVTYQWQQSSDNGTTWANVAAAGNGATYAPPALIADMLYKRLATSDLGGFLCTEETGTVKVTVINFDPGSITADQTICEGSNAAPFTSVTPSGDGSFTYKWYKSVGAAPFTVIPGATSETYSSGIHTLTTRYYREVTATLGGKTCIENTNTVTITVDIFNPGSIAADQTICETNDPAPLTSVAPTGAGTFTYKWYESFDGTVYTEIVGATLATFDPPVLTQDTWYKRSVTSSLNGNLCTEETAPVRIWVINFNPGTIGSDQTICEGSAPATFTGTAPSGDGVFTYTWEYSLDSLAWLPVGGAISSTYTAPALAADRWYRRVVTATLNTFTCSETTPPVKVTVNNFVPGSIAAPQVICEGDVPLALTSVPASGDGLFTYQWQSSLNGVVYSNITGETNATFAPPALMADTWYKRLVTSTLNGNTCTEETAPVQITVNNLTAGSISADQVICEGDVPVPFASITPVTDGAVSYEWQSSSDGLLFAAIVGATNETYAPLALTADTWYKRIVRSTIGAVVCQKESNVIKVTVNNFLPGSIAANQTICDGGIAAAITSVTPTGDGIFTYRWFSSIDGTTFAVIPGAINETYNPGTLIADRWYYREVTSTLLGKPCVEVTNTVNITVINFAPGTVSADQTICEGGTPAPFTSVAPSGDGVFTFQWRSSNDGVNYLDIAGANLPTFAPGSLTQDTWYIRRVTSTLNGVSCVKETPFVKVTVNNVNGGTIISDQTICNGADPVAFISVVTGSGDGIVTFQWQSSTNGVLFNDIVGANGPGYDSPAITQDTWFKRITKSLLTGVECTKETNVVKITVNVVNGGAIGSDQTVCFGSTPAPFTSSNNGSGTGVVTYQWYRSDNNVIYSTIPGATAATYVPGVHFVETYYKRVLISIQNGITCTAESNVIKISVNPLPFALLSGGATICPGETATLNVNLPIGTGPFILNIENHGIVAGYVSDANITVTPGATTTYRLLSVTDANGCLVTAPSGNLMGNATVIVRALPSIVTQPISKITCEYGVVTFSTVATGSDLNYQWYVNDGGGFDPVVDGGVYFGANAATLNIFGATRDMTGYIYNVTVSGCAPSVTSNDVTLTVNTSPEIITQPRDTTICSTGNAQYRIVAQGTALTYQWQVKIGAAPFVNVTDGGIYSGANAATLNLTGVPGTMNNSIFRVIVDGTCGVPLYSNFVLLRVNVPPTPVIHPTNKAICDGSGPVFFIANGSGLLDSIRWQVSTNGGGTWNDIYDNATYSGTTTQQLSLINVPIAYHNNQYRLALKAFCATTYTNAAVLTVNSNPVVTFISDPIPACGGVGQVITPLIAGGSGTWTQHMWTGDVGALNNFFIPTPTFKTVIPGTYNITYRVRDSNGCYGEESVAVVVDSPDASFTQDEQFLCTPGTVNFTKDMTGITSWSWDFGDGSPLNTTDANPSHIFVNASPTAISYYNVKLTVFSASGCSATFTQLTTVYPGISAVFTPNKLSVCSGETITFTSLPGAGSYMWDYGDGTSGPGVAASTHMFLNSDPLGTPVVYTVKLVTTSYYGCKDSTTVTVTLLPKPMPDFTPAPTPQIYNPAGNLVNFTNLTNPGAWIFTWTFGDGSPTSAATNPTHTYNGIGAYNITLKAENALCSATIIKQVNIVPEPPVASFDSIPPACAPYAIQFNNTSTNRTTPGTIFRWDFGDGSVSTAMNPTYTYYNSGSYRVVLTVIGPGGTSTIPHIVVVKESPIAFFSVTPEIVFVNDERVRCINLSQLATSYLWEFGDGDTSRMADPYHKYMEEGVYDITLWAYNEECTDKFVLSPGVTVEPAGELRFSTVFTPNLTGPIEIDELPTGGDALDQFFFPPIREKVVNYKLQIFNRLGLLIFESRSINKPWNGYYKGQLCPQGVYVWYVEGKYANGKPFKKVGDVTLLH